MEITSLLSIFKEFRDWLIGIDKATLEHNKEEKSALKSLKSAIFTFNIIEINTNEGY